MNDMQQLQTQARRSFRYWPVLLVLRMRQLEQHVTSEQLADLPLLMTSSGIVPDVSVLTEYGLPTPEQLPSLAMPELEECPPARSYFFRAGKGENYATLDLLRSSDAEYHTYETMRMALEDQRYLQKAAVCLDRIIADLGPAEALRQAKLWSLLHGCVPQSWVIVPQSEQEIIEDTPVPESEFEPVETQTNDIFSDNGVKRSSFEWRN